MKRVGRNNGFSLTEMLMAIGILTVGMLFVAGVFPVAIHFTTIATERTMAAVVADEAFAKIRLFGLSPSYTMGGSNTSFTYSDSWSTATNPITADEFAYPSISNVEPKRYYWSALCRNLGDGAVQVTVFVSRKIRPNLEYLNPLDVSRPMLVQVAVTWDVAIADELVIDNIGQQSYINDGYTIVDNATGDIYRVLERYADSLNRILLDRYWEGAASGSVWVVPPAVNGKRYPVVGVFQRVIKF